MQNIENSNLATPTVSEENSRIRFRVRQSARIIFAAASILVVIASIFCWVRSFVVGDRSYFSGAFELGQIEWREDRGYGMLCFHDRYPTPYDPTISSRLAAFVLGKPEDEERVVLRLNVLEWDFESRRHFGFGADRRDAARYFDHQGSFAFRAAAVRMPLWFPTMLGLLTAFVALRAVRRNWYAALPTRCRNCGYDLRAGHDKCPECGGESHVKVGAANSTDNPPAPTVQH